MRNQFLCLSLSLVIATPLVSWAQRRQQQRLPQAQINQIQRIERTRKKTPLERNHETVLKAFDDLIGEARKSVVTVKCEGSVVARGIIVEAGGLILTKASELYGKIDCSLHDGKELPAELVSVDDNYDVALLRVPSKNLQVAPLASQAPVTVGSVVATSGLKKTAIAVGTISVAERSIRQRGFLGISFAQGSNVPKIANVIDGGAAKKAGVKVGDVIKQINGIDIKEIPQVLEAIGERAPGEVIKIKIVRGEDEEVSLEAKLGKRPPNPTSSRFANMNQMGGALSSRRSGFPVVIQHDTVIFPDQCGSPLVDTAGKIIGMNIARSGRVSSLAIPATKLVELLPALKKGKPSSAFLVAMQSKSLDLKIAKQQQEVTKAEKSVSDAQRALDKAKNRLAEIEKQKKDLNKGPEAESKKALAANDDAKKKADKKPAANAVASADMKPADMTPASENKAETKPAEPEGNAKVEKGDKPEEKKPQEAKTPKELVDIQFTKALGSDFLRRIVPQMLKKREDVGEKWYWQLTLQFEDKPLAGQKIVLKWKDGETEVTCDEDGKAKFELTSKRLKELKFAIPRGSKMRVRWLGGRQVPRRA